MGHTHKQMSEPQERTRYERGGKVNAMMVWRRSEKVVALEQDPGACLGLGDVGMGVGETGGGVLREGKRWASLLLKSKYQIPADKVTNAFMSSREKRAISDCVGAARKSQPAIRQ